MKVSIVTTRTVLSPSGPRVGQKQTIIVFKTEAGQNMLATVDKDPVADADIQAAIKAELDKEAAHKGKTFTF
jgi:hypothetical protein